MNRLQEVSTTLARLSPGLLSADASVCSGAKLERPSLMRSRPLGDVCLEIAKFAQDRDNRTLDFLMRTAADEAYQCIDEPVVLSASNSEVIGLWDWDVTNDQVYADPITARLFGLNAKQAICGIEIESFITKIYPDDVPEFAIALNNVMTTGGCFSARYRLIANDQIKWVYAKGSCFLDKDKQPSRFPGVLFDITNEMAPIF